MLENSLKLLESVNQALYFDKQQVLLNLQQITIGMILLITMTT